MFASGERTTWSNGLTAETSPVVAKHAERMKGTRYHFYDEARVMELITDRLGDRFTLLTPVSVIAVRANNRTQLIGLRCNRCEKQSFISVYNVVRKRKHRCRACDIPKKWTSAGEDEMIACLKVEFGQVTRQVYVNGWSIDAHVPSIDTFFQFDGIYWHALDRPIEVIRASQKPSDRKLARKYDRDRAADAWFAENGVKLVRVIELEWTDAEDKRALLLEKIDPSSERQGVSDRQD